eukprot:6313659-Prorocentrum_lima.AAC.1
MTSSLVGSEMCIRDRSSIVGRTTSSCCAGANRNLPSPFVNTSAGMRLAICLLYTSDAADDM